MYYTADHSVAMIAWPADDLQIVAKFRWKNSVTKRPT